MAQYDDEIIHSHVPAIISLHQAHAGMFRIGNGGSRDGFGKCERAGYPDPQDKATDRCILVFFSLMSTPSSNHHSPQGELPPMGIFNDHFSLNNQQQVSMLSV